VWVEVGAHGRPRCIRLFKTCSTICLLSTAAPPVPFLRVPRLGLGTRRGDRRTLAYPLHFRTVPVTVTSRTGSCTMTRFGKLTGAFAVGCLAAGADLAAQGEKKAALKLEGGYTIVKGEHEGEPLPPERIKGAIVRFTKDEVIGTD